MRPVTLDAVERGVQCRQSIQMQIEGQAHEPVLLRHLPSGLGKASEAHSEHVFRHPVTSTAQDTGRICRCALCRRTAFELFVELTGDLPDHELPPVERDSVISALALRLGIDRCV